MSMFDSFLVRGFKASKCKTLLKLTIPRIKLLRNRKELNLKQMRRDIAKLLETGQEATARIRVEHIIREENMMAAQEIIELFSELIAVRLPIIESQRECPLDLKEAISSICFAAPRCADLPELMQVQMAFSAKYGKEFVAAATELMPNCGVNRQLIELLSVRAPSPEKKLKLLKEIAEEHELEWDPSPSESELFKSHEDLLNGPVQFVSGSILPLPKEKHDEISQSAPVPGPDQRSDSEESFDDLEFPEVPKVLLRPGVDPGLVMPPPHPSAPHPELYQTSSSTHVDPNDDILQTSASIPQTSTSIPQESKKFLPFTSPPSPSLSFPTASSFDREISESPPRSSEEKTEDLHKCRSLSKEKMDDLNHILASAKAAAESAERAAGEARSAAALAEVRISEITKSRRSDISSSSPVGDSDNPFFADTNNLSASSEKGDDTNDLGNNVFESKSPYDDDFLYHAPEKLPSMEDTDFSYPNLFSPPKSHSPDNSQPR